MDNTSKILITLLSAGLFLSLALNIYFVTGIKQSVSSVSNAVVNEAKTQATVTASAKLINEAETACVDDKNDPAKSMACLDNFYNSKAINLRDEAPCRLLDNEHSITNCLDRFYQFLAVNPNPEPEACQKLSVVENRLPCANESYFYLAQLQPQKAQEYCSKINGEALQKLCLDKFAK